MRFSERWLRTMVDPSLTTDELSHLLTMSGLEVEECEPVAPPCSGIVAAEVLTVGTHPSADRLSVCSVDAGIGQPLQIVCGAPNVVAGMKVPCALVGATMRGESPDTPLEIRPAKMRGLESQGMLCSARELGLSDDHSGLLALAPDTIVGSDIRAVLGLDDFIFTIKLTPNRADCLSVLGVAREVAALTGCALKSPAVALVPAANDATFPVRISAPDGCGRFAGRVIRNVNAAAPTPAWMMERLERAGQRSISALVDVTNYVMLELGRPLHVYDLDKLRGGIDVRAGRDKEHLKLLNEQTVDVDSTVLCITDDTGPIGLAGIMGGDSTKADLATRNIFLESAFFFPAAIAGRARRYNFSSDASHRFERGVDFSNNLEGIERATRLILDICGGEAGPSQDVVARLPERQPVRMRLARAHKIIGVPVTKEEIERIFVRLQLKTALETGAAGDVFVVTPPAWRFDIEIEEDLIEEVARVHGFERIPALPPVVPAIMRTPSERRRSMHDIRRLLAANDFQEVINFSFAADKWETDLAGNATPIRLVNPISSEQSVMRSILLGGLLENVRYNAGRKIERIRVFEIGRVFSRDASMQDGDLDVAGIRQPMRVGAIACGSAQAEQWGSTMRAVDFFDLKGTVEALLAPRVAQFESAAHPALHPGRSARIVLDGRVLGWLGELHPRWQRRYDLPQTVVAFELDAEAIRDAALPAFSEVSKFPPVVRDMALVLPEKVAHGALLGALNAARSDLVRDIHLFDIYRGKGVEPGKKSLAFRVVMQDTAKTLTDAEADSAMAQLIEAVTGRFGAKLRT
ncbi:MAG: phenylalanine--tRNA ligase subunit beta [Betaproteobacteria bacterium]|nr:phenylalanine--tRNA ligase subunit beta [Betaproteobacteria bacterium]